jgi:replicative DNA helicase
MGMAETTKEKARKDLLAWCLWLPDEAIPKVMERVQPADFPDPDDRMIFQAMIDLFNRGEAVDLVTLCRELEGKMDGRVDKLVKFIDRSITVKFARLKSKNQKWRK